MCARREEDPISTTLKVITLIKAVMCGDGRAEEEGWWGAPSFMGQFGDHVIQGTGSVEWEGGERERRGKRHLALKENWG